MKNVARLSETERKELFQATAIAMGMQSNVIEKDFWVCFMLDHLFHDCKYKDAFVFKGGTSLSKAYHVIERFSEDIDLILDWRKLMRNMIYGNVPEFAEMLTYLRKLQEEIRDLRMREKQEQQTSLREKVLQAEQERISGAETLSIASAREKVQERAK